MSLCEDFKSIRVSVTFLIMAELHNVLLLLFEHIPVVCLLPAPVSRQTNCCLCFLTPGMKTRSHQCVIAVNAPHCPLRLERRNTCNSLTPYVCQSSLHCLSCLMAETPALTGSADVRVCPLTQVLVQHPIGSATCHHI